MFFYTGISRLGDGIYPGDKFAMCNDGTSEAGGQMYEAWKQVTWNFDGRVELSQELRPFF
jgi:hypothetical protein